MAGALQCDVDPGHGEAAFLVSFLEQSDAKAFCTACFARTGLEVALAVLPGDEVLGRVNRPTPAASNGEGAPPDAAPRKRARKKPAATRPERGDAAPAQAGPPPADE